MKEILHFSHANGFPAGSYNTLLSYLSDDFDIGTIDRLGHDEAYPVTNNWEHLSRQLINELEQRYTQPVYAVGHSLGGVLSLMVASQRPDLVKGLVMLDAPCLTHFETMGLSLVKYLGLMDKVTPAGRTLGRKESWNSVAEAQAYFRQKKLFQGFDPRCLNDYVLNGTVDDESGTRKLHFDAATEIQIYRTIPNTLHKSPKLKMPSLVVAGTGSDVFKKQHERKMKRQLGMSVEWLQGSHMFPLEKPEETAALIKQYITQWKCS